jgi:hypothetical protein
MSLGASSDYEDFNEKKGRMGEQRMERFIPLMFVVAIHGGKLQTIWVSIMPPYAVPLSG